MSDLVGEAHQLHLLIALQGVDRETTERREDKRRLPEDVEAARTQLESARQRADQMRAELETVTKQRRAREQDLKVQEERLAKVKGRVTDLKTNKEYLSHLREVEQAKAEQGRLEDEIILLMDQQDTLHQTLAVQEESVVEATRRFDAAQTRMATETARLDDVLTRLQEERLSAVSQVTAGLLSEYEELREKRKGLAVVPIEREACMGCRLSLPPQLSAEVRKGEKIQCCINCQRLLYWPAHHVPVANHGDAQVKRQAASS